MRVNESIRQAETERERQGEPHDRETCVSFKFHKQKSNTDKHLWGRDKERVHKSTIYFGGSTRERLFSKTGLKIARECHRNR